MSTFFDQASFNMSFNEIVQFRISAQNINGWGSASQPNTLGARVLTAPRFMNAPVRDERTHDQQLFINW
jgi:hypothetical protein